MRILFDQGTPVPLRKLLSSFEVKTAYELGWSTLTNGELLDKAERDGFDILLTTDQNLRDQQNITKRKLAIVVLSTTSWPRIERASATIINALMATAPGRVVELAIE